MLDARALPYLAVYGLLRPGGSGFRRFRLACRLIHRGPCLLAGALYDLGGYPGLVTGAGRVSADLFEIADPGVLGELDAFEDYDPAQPGASLYIRERQALIEPAGQAWVYRYNRAVGGYPPIPSGDWAVHAAVRRLR